eukprot:TRINITY_DN3408_c0_g1_i11.p1 TRINITY_DN3408_c0_g1~~TRINITY_DN3408_c0_g1_i11.p1  ORF type:complete len:973 (+),score=149.03 TRINITY_DN3408_c0_g1_i11:153-3071(+)
MNRQAPATQSLRMKIGSQKPSRALDDFIRSIGDCKSKIDEDRIMVREDQNLRAVFSSGSLKGKELEEALLRAMYLNILNYDSDFALIPALNGLASKDLRTKRICYLATSLFIQPDSSELLLLVNSIQKDLIDDNYLVKWTALSALTAMINHELVPAILPQVCKCLSHPKELIRKKTVLALQRFIQLDAAAALNGEGAANSVLEGTGIGQMLRTALCDKDPSVMGASLNAFMEVVRADPEQYRNLVPSFVSILKQVIERRLPRTYEYKKHPAPWMQIRLLKLISCLCAGDRAASENAYAILAETMKAANTGTPIGTAIMYECILTIANIFPSTGLLSQVETLLDPWVKSHSINLKHAFLRSQIQLSKVNTDFSKKYQRAIVEFMEYPDTTLQWMAFLLLCEITRSHNIAAILPHLVTFCEQITDERMRLDLAHRIYELAEKYAPDFEFFVEAAQDVFRVLGEGSEDSKEQDLVWRFVSSFKDQPQELIPQALSLWVDALLDQGIRTTTTLAIASVILVGQYGHLNSSPASDLMDRLCDTYTATTNENVRRHIIHSLLSLSVKSGSQLTPEAQKLIEKATISRDWVIQSLAIQAQALIEQQQFGSPTTVLPALDSAQTVEVDENLPFLDVYVQSAIANGARPYLAPEDRVFGEEDNFSVSVKDQRLKMDAYEYPVKPASVPTPQSVPQTQSIPQQQPSNLLNFDGMSTPQGSAAAPESVPVQASVPAPVAPQADPFQLNIRTNKWGAKPPPPAAQPAPTPAPQQPQQADFLFGDGMNVTQQPPTQQQQSQLGSISSQPEPEEEELDEKGMLAKSLFGGIPGGSSNRRSKISPRPQRSRPMQSTQKPASSAPDLLAFDSPSAPQRPSVQNSSQGQGLDLLDFSFDSGASQPQQTQQMQQGGMDLLGGMGSVPQQQTQYNAQDPFGHMQQVQQQPQSGSMFGGMQGATTNGQRSVSNTPKKGPNTKSSDPFADLLG